MFAKSDISSTFQALFAQSFTFRKSCTFRLFGQFNFRQKVHFAHRSPPYGQVNVYLRMFSFLLQVLLLLPPLLLLLLLLLVLLLLSRKHLNTSGCNAGMIYRLDYFYFFFYYYYYYYCYYYYYYYSVGHSQTL